MLKKMTVQEAMDKGKGSVELFGWVYRERHSNQLAFIVLRDSSNIIQCVIEKEKASEKTWEEALKAKIESSVSVKGEIAKDERAPTGYEVKVKELEIIGPAEDFPIGKDQGIEFLLDNRHLWLRSRKMASILKIRSTCFEAIHEFFRKEGFYEFQSPCLTASAGESGSTQFKVDYFGEPMYLTQTWQLYAEAGVFALEKIYCIAPSFRAEPSKTSRHLTEYWHAEMEAAWIDFNDLQDYGEKLIKHIMKKVLEKNKEELKLLERDAKKLEPTVEKKFPRITYDEALKLLDKKGMKVKWGKDLRTLEEDKLSEYYDTPVIVTRYPKEVKAFYMKEDPENEKVVLGFDMIAPENYGEIIGASQREEKPEEITRKLKAQGEKPEKYSWYLDLRKYGSVPHGGFGLGVERVISWVCGLDSIKDAIPFPRTMYRKTP